MSIQNCVAINAELQSMRYKVLNLYSYNANCYTHVGTQYCNYQCFHMAVGHPILLLFMPCMICCCTHIVLNVAAITVCMTAFAILHSCCTHMDTTIIDCMIACISSCTHACFAQLFTSYLLKVNPSLSEQRQWGSLKVLFYPILFYSILFYSILFYSILFYSILFCSILFYSILYSIHALLWPALKVYSKMCCSLRVT